MKEENEDTFMVATTQFDKNQYIVCEGDTHGFTLQFEIETIKNNNKKIYCFHLFINENYVHSFGIC